MQNRCETSLKLLALASALAFAFTLLCFDNDKIVYWLIFAPLNKMHKYVKELKKTKLILFSGRYCHVNKILCSIHTLYTTNAQHLSLRRHDQSNHLVTTIDAALNWSGSVMIGGGGGPPQHQTDRQIYFDQEYTKQICINITENTL